MGFSMTSTPAPAWLRELAAARATYQELLGWPVSVQVGRRNLVVAVGKVLDAVTIPAALGVTVRAELMMSTVFAPIVSSADGRFWAFLVKPVGAIRPAVSVDLSEAGVQLAAPGSQVVVPAGMDVSGGPGERWIESPRPSRALPPVDAVVGPLRHLT
jgi:hypothetical protein